ncbi:MAG: secondary thiamine-phosphate synthase enzyme YjbQ [Chloroflexota bacterium]
MSTRRSSEVIRIELASSRRTEAIDVTHLFASRTWPDGLLAVSVEHTTAAIFLGESGSEMFADYERVAAGLIEQFGPFQHETWNPGNAQSHVMSSFIGTQLLLPIRHGQLNVGTWQRVIFLELDGPRKRSIAVMSLAAKPLE